MSLKAKIEAVIYASEEPVTLAQLVGLLGQEAQADLDREREAQQALALEAGPDTPLVPESTDSEAAAVPPAEAAPEAATPEATPTATEPGAAAPKPESPEADSPETEAGPDGKKKKLTDAEKQAAKRLREYFRTLLDELIADYATGDRGLEIREVANGYRLSTKPEYHDAVRGFVKSLKPVLKLSLPALETLAVIAYKQPVTAPEISEVRGVDSGGVLGSLLSRKLIGTAGRKQVIGRPILYKTTKDFLLRFGLKDISELPSIEEFEKMAGELAEQEEIPMSDHASDESVHADEAAAEHPSADALKSDHDLLEEENAVEPPPEGIDDRPNLADDVIVDGRVSGLPPAYAREEFDDDPSAREAAEQQQEQADETHKEG